MKPVILSLLAIAVAATLQAQTFGCDGTRYVAPVFTEVVKTTVNYGSNTNLMGANQTLSMDVYEPAGDVLTQRPVIIMIHGGSFILGYRQDMDAICTEWAKKGYVAATIDYRLWPLFFGLPDSTEILGVVVSAVQDAKAAVRYFRADAAGSNTYHADPNYIIIGGLSAGAITALHTAYLDADDNISPELETILNDQGGLEGNSGNPGFSSEVSGVVSLSGGLNRVEWLSAGEVPLVSMHGTADAIVPYNHGLANDIISVDGSNILHPIADDLGIPNFLHTVPGGGHVDIYIDAQYETNRSEFDYQSAAFLHDNVICMGTVLGTDLIGTQAISAAPNPTNGDISVFVGDSPNAYTATLHDLTGRTLMQRSSSTDSSFAIAHPGTTGVYILRIVGTNGRTSALKLIFE